VTGKNGRPAKIDLAAALLPTFDEWRQSAPAAEREHARRYFSLLKRQHRLAPERALHTLPQTA
jgi:hypothetical protein